MQKALKVENLLKKRFFISQSNGIYGGVAGFFDYGPLGCTLRNNILNFWRDVFTRESNIFEVETSIILPEIVLKASGHVDKFCDTLIFDAVNGECLRADHYLKDKVDEETRERLEVMSLNEINEAIEKFNVKSPAGNALGNATHFNLMFSTFIGPKSQSLGYLRPETAQGQFLNFKNIYDLNCGKMPFGTFSIGKVFRNEISPRGGLLRVREFEQAEIEFYVHPDEKTHRKYESVKDLQLTLHFGPEVQKTRIMRLDEAIKQKIVKTECVGYFMGLTHKFLTALGFKDFRFRQHKKDEMAHYACDCWDAEIMTTFGFIECVGIADRSAYDLSMHAKFSKTSLVAQRKLKRPRMMTKIEPQYDLRGWGKRFGNKLPLLLKKIKSLEISEERLSKTVEFEDETVIVEYKRTERPSYVEDYVTSVIEPSFGVSRLFYSLVDQIYWERENEEDRGVLSFSPIIAPYQVGISSLRADNYTKQQEDLLERLKDKNVRAFINERKISIGRKYAGADEIGVPFFITFDAETVNDEQVTIRERDSRDQVRVELSTVAEVVEKLITGVYKFQDIWK